MDALLLIVIGIAIIVANFYYRERAKNADLEGYIRSQAKEEEESPKRITKEGVIANLSDIELRHIAAERSLFIGLRPELFGLVTSQGFVVIPAKEFEDSYIVQREGWAKLLTTLGNLEASIGERNHSDERFGKYWLERGDEK